MMRTRTLVVLATLLLLPSAALAQERATDAALGAVSGAVVLGPIGAVAGALVGFTAGPSISRSWGLHRSASRDRARRSANQETYVAAEGQPAQGVQPPRSETAAAAPVAPTQPASPGKSAAAPPVQTLE